MKELTIGKLEENIRKGVYSIKTPPEKIICPKCNRDAQKHINNSNSLCEIQTIYICDTCDTSKNYCF